MLLLGHNIINTASLKRNKYIMNTNDITEGPFKSLGRGFAKGFQAGKASPDMLNRGIKKALDPDSYGDDKVVKKAEWKGIPVTPVKVTPGMEIPNSVKELPKGTGFKDPKGNLWQWAGQSWVKKTPGGWQGGQINNNSAFKMYIDALKQGKAYKPIKRESDMKDIIEGQLSEKQHDPKHVKMAIGIASDPRYKGGNMTGATKAIDKIKKGLSDHPQVAAVLKRQNETVKEGQLGDMAHRAEQDHEVQMARAELYKLAKYSIKLHDMLKGVSEAEGLDGWVQSKITKAANDIGSVYHHMDYEEASEEELPEPKINLETKAHPYKDELHAKLAEARKK